jgi:uncharacterized membrane protein
MLFINKLNTAYKLLLSLALSFIVYFLVLIPLANATVRFLCCWDIFCLLFLTLNWITFWTVKPSQIRKEASIQNAGKILVFIVSLIATIMALTAVLQLLVNKSHSFESISFTLVVAVSGLLLSWVLVHSIFAIRYAHLFYANHKLDQSKHAGGLIFPEEEHPDFLDFAYYSFVIGMTFQVSDVNVSSKELRRLTLFHSLLAFAFNTIIVALTVNVIAGLSK